jgi:antirestriction protein ArdC
MAGYHRPVTDADRAAAADARQATLDKLHAQLRDGILALNDPQAWQAWLKFSSQFHRYSFGNSLLIMLQDPQATHVAGYQAFKAMGRQVRRGETGIKVLAPITRREPRLDDAGQPMRDDQGRVLHRTQVVATKPVTVFDVRQTDGPPLPDPKIGEANLLTGQAPIGLWDGLQGLLEERGFEVRRGACHDGANGYTDFARRLVMVRDDVDDAQSVKTLAHEGAHSILHSDRSSLDCRGILEVEAESVAYMVTSAHGLDSSQYTFNYVAGWALNAVTEERDLADILRSTGQRVIGAADLILQTTQPAPTITDTALEALESDIRVQTDSTRWEAVSVGGPITPEPPIVPSPALVPSLGR